MAKQRVSSARAGGETKEGRRSKKAIEQSLRPLFFLRWRERRNNSVGELYASILTLSMSFRALDGIAAVKDLRRRKRRENGTAGILCYKSDWTI
jgi:hypothetical protein